jgi:hypothetical protein
VKTIQLLCHALVAVALLATGSSHAQRVVGMGLPSQAKAGEPVKVTVHIDVSGGMNCGLHIRWGDGASDTFKIKQAGDVPLHASHTYAKPGGYTVVADPGPVGGALKCDGLNQHAPITIVDRAAKAGVAAPAKEGPTRLPALKSKP